MIERKKVSLDHERKLLMNMIVSTRFLRDIVPMLNPAYLKARYTQLIAEWIKEYYSEFNEAPKQAIQDIYLEKRKFIVSEEDTDLVATFLTNLSSDYASASKEVEDSLNNIEFSIKQATLYLKRRSIEYLKEQIDTALTHEDISSAEKLIASYSRIEMQQVKGIDVFQDIDKVYEAFNSREEKLFEFSGELGKTVGAINRGDFVSFLAFAKRGKSTWLMYSAERALLAGKNVVFVSLEMTENQVLRRLWESHSGLPRYEQEVVLPEFIRVPSSSSGHEWGIRYNTEYREAFPNNIDEIEAIRIKYNRLCKGSLRLITLPARSATMKDIDNHLSNLFLYEGFTPDVVVIDYADLIAPAERQEHRHQLDQIWADCRKMAVERNIALLTVSQSNRGSANNDLSEESISEDIRKIAHVTMMIGINQSKSEHKNGLYRIGVLAKREGKLDRSHVLCLSCLDIAKPCMDSKMADDVEYTEEDDKKGDDKYEQKKRDKALDKFDIS